jgi:hypothetical protein
MSLFVRTQKGVVYGHITAQNVICRVSCGDLASSDVKLVCCDGAFGIALSSGQSDEQPFDSVHLSTSTA